MYICICNAIRENDLRAVAHCAIGSADDAYAALGRRPQCGQCLDDAEAILADARNAESMSLSL